MATIPNELLYTDQHEWLRVEGDSATVGITDYAQEHLGDITFVELPAVGATVARGAELCVIESAKAASSVYAPASGKIVAVNEDVGDDPADVNAEPYGAGWLVKLELTDTSELASLLRPDAYKPLTLDD